MACRLTPKKHRYLDEIAAKLAMATIKRKDQSYRGKQEQRAYRCPGCHGWHLTSKRSKR